MVSRAYSQAHPAPSKNKRQYETRGVNMLGATIPIPTGRVRSPGSGVTLRRYSGQASDMASRPSPNYWQSRLAWDNAQAGQPPQTPGENMNPNGSGGGYGGGGGGARGPSPDQIRGLADQLFAFNAGPYDLMRQNVGNQRSQANAYNPNFAAMEADFNQRQRGFDAERAKAVEARLSALAGFGAQLAGQQSTAMQGALRDLANQGVGVGQYVDQSNQLAAERTANLANQGGYMGQLNASAANQAADYQRGAGLIRQGGEATLANNRGTLLNQLAQQEAQIALQQAQAQQANDQARREFMLKYGVL